MKTLVTHYLESAGIEYKIKRHSRDVYTCEDAAKERGVKIEQIVKTMIVKKPDGELIAVLISGNKRLNTKKLAKILGCKKVQIAPKEEVEKATGYKIGAIAPIGFKREMKIYMDKDVLKEEIVDISSGRPDAGIELKSEDLAKVTKAEIIDFGKVQV